MPLSSASESYLDEAAAIAAYGLPVLTQAQAAKVAANPAGPYLLDMIKRAAWDAEAADRDIRRHAAAIRRYAEEIEAAIGGHMQIPGPLGGETWVTTSARDLQTAVNARRAAIERIQEFTYAADQINNA